MLNSSSFRKSLCCSSQNVYRAGIGVVAQALSAAWNQVGLDRYGSGRWTGPSRSSLTASQRSQATREEGNLEKAKVSCSLKDKEPNLKGPCSLKFCEAMGQRQLCCGEKVTKLQDKTSTTIPGIHCYTVNNHFSASIFLYSFLPYPTSTHEHTYSRHHHFLLN